MLPSIHFTTKSRRGTCYFLLFLLLTLLFCLPSRRESPGLPYRVRGGGHPSFDGVRCFIPHNVPFWFAEAASALKDEDERSTALPTAEELAAERHKMHTISQYRRELWEASKQHSQDSDGVHIVDSASSASSASMPANGGDESHDDFSCTGESETICVIPTMPVTDKGDSQHQGAHANTYTNWSQPGLVTGPASAMSFCDSQAVSTASSLEGAFLSRICALYAYNQMPVQTRVTTAATSENSSSTSTMTTTRPATATRMDITAATRRSSATAKRTAPDITDDPSTASTVDSVAPDASSVAVAVSVHFVEPSGYIGYGASLSPFVFVGLYREVIQSVYMDGVFVEGVVFLSNYSFQLPTIPAYPSPPLDMLECKREFLNSNNTYNIEDTNATANANRTYITPVTLSIITVLGQVPSDTMSYADGVHSFADDVAGVRNGTLRNTTITFDGLQDKPLLARHSTYTAVLMGVPMNTHVMSHDGTYYTTKTLNGKWSTVQSGSNQYSPLTDPNTFSMYDRLTAARHLYTITFKPPFSQGSYYIADGFNRSKNSRTATTKPRKLPSRTISVLLSGKQTANHTLTFHLAQREEAAAVVQRYSARLGTYTYSPTSTISNALPNTSLDEYTFTENGETVAGSNASFVGRDKTFVLQCRTSPSESLAGNGTSLVSTGEITGDATTATITVSLYHPKDAYHLYVVMPNLELLAMFTTVPAVYGIDFWGVRLIDETTLFATEKHGLNIAAALPRKTMSTMDGQWEVRLQRVAMPTLPASTYEYVVDLYDATATCSVSAATLESLSCDVELYAAANDGYNDNFNGNFVIDPVDSCGAGTVVYVFLKDGLGTVEQTAAKATKSMGSTLLLDPFPVTINTHSIFRFRTLSYSYPLLEQQLYAQHRTVVEAAAAAGALAVVEEPLVVFRYLFVSKNVYFGTFRVHCYGDGDVDVALRSRSKSGKLIEHVCQVHSNYTPSASAPIKGSSFFETVSNYTFTGVSDMVFNLTCTHRLKDVVDYLVDFVVHSGDSNSLRHMGIFCGVSLEVESLTTWIEPTELPSYSIVEIRAPIVDGASSITLNEEDGPEGIRITGELQDVILSFNGSSPPSFSSSSPFYSSSSSSSAADTETATTPQASEVVAVLGSIPSRAGCRSNAYARFSRRNATSSDYMFFSDKEGDSTLRGINNSTRDMGRRWYGEGGYPVRRWNEATQQAEWYCHWFVAVPLDTPNESCEHVTYSVQMRSGKGSSNVSVQQVFCGSRTHFMDPINNLQMRVPLREVPNLVNLSSLVLHNSSDKGLIAYQYCVDVQVELDDVGRTSAFQSEGPLIYTVLDTAHAVSKFSPWVRRVIPSGDNVTAAASLGDVIYFTGFDLRYRLDDSPTNTSLTSSFLTLHLAKLEFNDCLTTYWVNPMSALDGIVIQLVNDSTIAMPVNELIPAGWFNMTMTSESYGDVWVDCGLSVRVLATVTSVYSADISDTSGGIKVIIRGSNLPLYEVDNSVVMLGLNTNLSSSPVCSLYDSTTTTLTCVTPALTVAQIESLSIGLTEGAQYYKIPINLTVFYAENDGTLRALQSITTDSVENGDSWFYVPYSLGSKAIETVTPQTVSVMQSSYTFTLTGNNFSMQSLLLCSSSPVPTGDGRSMCVTCLPRTWSTTQIVCDVKSGMAAGVYRIYMQDTPVNAARVNITVKTVISAYSPKIAYPYGGAIATIIGSGFAFSDTRTAHVVAEQYVAEGGELRKRSVVPIAFHNSTTIQFITPDVRWLKDRGGYVRFSIVYDSAGSVLTCGGAFGCRVRVLPESQTPTITSLGTIKGQAPLLLSIYGTGFTMLTYSPKYAVRGETSAEMSAFVQVGGSRCEIVAAVNTALLCNLTTPCANSYVNSSVHLVSPDYGHTVTDSGDTNLLFVCDMRLYSISHSRGSTVGGQEVVLKGAGFPTDTTALAVYVAGLQCTLTSATRSQIRCVTGSTTDYTSLSGDVLVVNQVTTVAARCCSYTYDVAVTPSITLISPLSGIAGNHINIYGDNFLATDSENASARILSDASSVTNRYDCTSLTATDANGNITIVFGNRTFNATVVSNHCAEFALPAYFFGSAYISLYNADVGVSLPYTAGVLTVYMTPAIVQPRIGGFTSNQVISLIGTSYAPNRTDNMAGIIAVQVCGLDCPIVGTTSKGEVRCTVPSYLDVSLILSYADLFPFEVLRTGYVAYYWLPSFAESLSTMGANGTDETWGVARMFRTANPAPSSTLNSKMFYVLAAYRHSRLMVYSASFTLAPTTSETLNFSNTVCKLQVATLDAQLRDLFTDGADPENPDMWNASETFYWSTPNIGVNTLSFESSNTGAIPVGSYIGISCVNMPTNNVYLTNAEIYAFHVGLHDSSGSCPVNIISQVGKHQPVANSCENRQGIACATFQYSRDLTPFVLSFNPIALLATAAENSTVTMRGVNLGTDISAIESIVLDGAQCLPLTVQDDVLTCRMMGYISTTVTSRIKYHDPERGRAFFLSQLPFQAATAWSSYSTWMGAGVPSENNIVVIPSGYTILLDVSPPELQGILLDGVLIISDDIDIELRVNTFAITSRGSLIAGSLVTPRQHRFKITLGYPSSRLSTDDLSRLGSFHTEPPLDKILYVTGGTLQLHGQPPNYLRLYLAQAAYAGEETIVVAGRVDWKVGDVIILTSCGADFTHEEVTSIAGKRYNGSNTVLLLANPLNYTHIVQQSTATEEDTDFWVNWDKGFDSDDRVNFSEIERTFSQPELFWQLRNITAKRGAQVVLLTRTIEIEGNALSATSAIGGSVLIQQSTNSQLTNVAFHNMGKRGTQKGYAVWFDGVSNSVAKTVMENCTLFQSFHRGVVLSDTRYATLQGLMLHSFDGYGIAAIGTYHTALVVRDSMLSIARANKGSVDTTAAVTFFTYPTVTFMNNELIHSDGYGVWIALRSKFATSTQRSCPAIAPLASFSNNTVHLTRYQGIIIYPVQMTTVALCASNIFSNEDSTTNAVRTSAGSLINNTIFMCGTYGLHLPVMSGYNVSGLVVADCEEGSLYTSFSTSYLSIQNAVFWGTMPTGEETIFLDSLGGTDVETDLTTDTSSATWTVNSDSLCKSAKGSNCSTMRVGVHSLHGGFVTMENVVFGNFQNGTAMWLSTSVGQPSYSPVYDALVSTAEREVNNQNNGQLLVTVLMLELRGSRRWDVVLSGYTFLHDCDGLIAKGPNRDVYILANRAVLQNVGFCEPLNMTRNTNLLVFSSDMSVVEEPDGTAVVTLRPYSFRDWMSSMKEATLEAAATATGVTTCYAPDMSSYSSSVLQIADSDIGTKVFAYGSTPDDSASDSSANDTFSTAVFTSATMCPMANVTIEYEGGVAFFNTSLGGQLDNLEISLAAQVLFFTKKYSSYSFSAAGEVVFNGTLPQSAATTGRDGDDGARAFNTDESTLFILAPCYRGVTNISFDFMKRNGAACYPKSFRVTSTGAQSTNYSSVIVRVAINPMTYEVSDNLRHGTTWMVRRPRASLYNRYAHNRSSSHAGAPNVSNVPTSTYLEFANMNTIASTTTTLSPHVSASTAAFTGSPLTSFVNIFKPSYYSLMVETAHCSSGQRCLGTYLATPTDYVRKIVTTSWFNSTGWLDGNVPSDSSQGNADQVYVIPYGKRVILKDSNVTVPGVLVVLGELIVQCNGRLENATEAIASTMMISCESLIVLGSLKVNAAAVSGAKVLFSMGYVSAHMIDDALVSSRVNNEVATRDCAHRRPIFISESTAVSCGTVHVAGVAVLRGWYSAPSNWRARGVMTAGGTTLSPLVPLSRDAWTSLTSPAPLWRRAINSSYFSPSDAVTDDMFAMMPVEDRNSTLAWCAGDELGVTSSTWNRQEAEVRRAAADVSWDSMLLVPRTGKRNSTAPLWTDTAAVTEPWTYTHGTEAANSTVNMNPDAIDDTDDYRPDHYSHDVYSEVTVLTKQIEFVCAIPADSAQKYYTGCVVVVNDTDTAVLNSNYHPSLTAIGVRFTGFGRGGQFREDLTANRSFQSSELDGTRSVWSTSGISSWPALYAGFANVTTFLAGVVFYACEGPAVHAETGTDLSFVSFYMTDSVVWGSKGGGIITDGDNSTWDVSVNVNATMYQQVRIEGVLVTGTEYYVDLYGNTEATQSVEQSLTNVNSLCSFLMNQTTSVMTRCVAAGSASEGFCVYWRSGRQFVNNTAHSNLNGVFLFSIKYMADADSFFSTDMEDAFYYMQPSASTTFSYLRAYRNNLTGVYSSTHRNVKLQNVQLFGNVINAALTVSGRFNNGSSSIVNSYVACPTTCAEWAALAAAQATWCPVLHANNVSSSTAYYNGVNYCKHPEVFMDTRLRCAHFLLLPSYRTQQLDYDRHAVPMDVSGVTYERPCTGYLRLINVSLGSVGARTCAEGTTSRTTYEGAVFAGAAYVNNSASLYAVFTSAVQYVNIPPAAAADGSWTSNVIRVTPKDFVPAMAPRTVQSSIYHTTTKTYMFGDIAFDGPQESPIAFEDTVFHDADGTLYGGAAPAAMKRYIVRRSTYINFCDVVPQDKNLLTCPSFDFVQLMVRTLDERQAALNNIGIQFAVNLSTMRGNIMTVETLSAIVLANATSRTDLERGSCSHYSNRCVGMDSPSFSFVKKMLPRGTLTLLFPIQTYPDVFTLGFFACYDPTDTTNMTCTTCDVPATPAAPGGTSSSSASTVNMLAVELALLDASVEVSVWNSDGRQLPSGTVTTDLLSTLSSANVAKSASTNAAKWRIITVESPLTGRRNRTIHVELPCQSYVDVHQLTYGSMLTFAGYTTMEVSRSFINWQRPYCVGGDGVFLNLSTTNNMLVSLKEQYPAGPYMSSTSYARFRTTVIDTYAYNTTENQAAIDEVFSKFSLYSDFLLSHNINNSDATAAAGARGTQDAHGSSGTDGWSANSIYDAAPGEFSYFSFDYVTFYLVGIENVMAPPVFFQTKVNVTVKNVDHGWSNYGRLITFVVVVFAVLVLTATYWVMVHIWYQRFVNFFSMSDREREKWNERMAQKEKEGGGGTSHVLTEGHLTAEELTADALVPGDRILTVREMGVGRDRESVETTYLVRTVTNSAKLDHVQYITDEQSAYQVAQSLARQSRVAGGVLDQLAQQHPPSGNYRRGIRPTSSGSGGVTSPLVSLGSSWYVPQGNPSANLRSPGGMQSAIDSNLLFLHPRYSNIGATALTDVENPQEDDAGSAIPVSLSMPSVSLSPQSPQLDPQVVLSNRPASDLSPAGVLAADTGAGRASVLLPAPVVTNGGAPGGGSLPPAPHPILTTSANVGPSFSPTLGRGAVTIVAPHESNYATQPQQQQMEDMMAGRRRMVSFVTAGEAAAVEAGQAMPPFAPPPPRAAPYTHSPTTPLPGPQ